jgi:hypothetical protein
MLSRTGMHEKCVTRQYVYGMLRQGLVETFAAVVLALFLGIVLLHIPRLLLDTHARELHVLMCVMHTCDIKFS